MDPKTVKEFFRRLQAQRPNPTTELEYSSPFTLLVAVVLSAQSTDVGVNRVTAPLFAVASTPQAMIHLGEENIRNSIRSINYYKAKARHLIGLSHALIDRHDGQVPKTQAELMALPGVGRKTADVVRNIIFGEDTIAVDTHIFRVAHRTGLANGATPAAVSDQLSTVIPPIFRKNAHHWLILHGRYICKARKPNCPQCPVSDLCPYPDKTVDKHIALDKGRPGRGRIST